MFSQAILLTKKRTAGSSTLYLIRKLLCNGSRNSLDGIIPLSTTQHSLIHPTGLDNVKILRFMIEIIKTQLENNTCKKENRHQ
jgi:hypothetical protein